MRTHATLLLLTLAACAAVASPVEWRDASARAGDSLPGRLALRDDSAVFAPDTLAAGTATPAGACPGSVRVAWSGASGTERYAAWWAPRADSSAALLAARSVDGGRSWGAPEPVDTIDRANVGCSRPAPAIAADSASGYVHVAYSMRAPEGTGVFFSHSMERGHMFHSPVAIMYGEELTDAAIAVLRDTVAVAFVQPTGQHPGLGLALSRTMGHIFEHRLAVPSATDASDPAVAIASGRVALGWVQRSSAAAAVLMTRVGITTGSGTKR
ncbi:MAG TPA: hypothetical protein VHM30_01610 [Gemmatimonadaceae bacterium]|nr:hypothetical protein [Gemmatimonadaceae bacterium]